VAGANQIAIPEDTHGEIMRACSGASGLWPFQADKFYGWQQALLLRA
jgi:hypothetical protein